MTSYFLWTEQCIEELVGLRKSFEAMFSGKRGFAELGLETIASVISNRANPETLQKKWENLIKKYKDLKLPKTGISAEDGDDTPITWVFYNIINEWMSQKHHINPPLSLSTTNVKSMVENSAHCSKMIAPRTQIATATEKSVPPQRNDSQDSKVEEARRNYRKKIENI